MVHHEHYHYAFIFYPLSLPLPRLACVSSIASLFRPSTNTLETEEFDIVSVKKLWLVFGFCVLAQLQISANSKLIVNWHFYGWIQIEIWAKVQTRRTTNIVSMLWRKFEIKKIFAWNSFRRSGRREIRKIQKCSIDSQGMWKN